MKRMERHSTQMTLAGVVLIGVTVFLYQVAQVIQKIQSWEVLWNPPTVGELLMAVVFGLMAVGAALGLDVPILVRNLLPSLGGSANRGDSPPK